MSYRQTYVVQFGDMNEDVRKGRAGRLRAIPVEVGVD